MTFEEALTKLKNGAKIRRKTWSSIEFVRIYEGDVIDESGQTCRFDCEDLFSKDWGVFVEEEEYNWDAIIASKVLCAFSDFPTQTHHYGLLKCVSGGNFRFEDDRGVCWDRCVPVKDSEVNFFLQTVE